MFPISQVRLAQINSSGQLVSSRKLASHLGPANKLALLSDSPHVFLSGGEDAVVFNIDVRKPKADKLLTIKVQEPRRRVVPIYSVDASPASPELFCTSGRDKMVRLFDRRKISEQNAEPLKKFAPHHLVRSKNLKNYFRSEIDVV